MSSRNRRKSRRAGWRSSRSCGFAATTRSRSVALDEQGQPVSRWWPVAYALQRIGDRRAAGPLLTLVSGPGIYTPGLRAARSGRGAGVARRGAGARRCRARGRRRAPARRGCAAARPDRRRRGRGAAAETARRTGDAEKPRARGRRRARRAARSPRLRRRCSIGSPIRGLRCAPRRLPAAARIDPDGFLLVVSSLERDADWSVRAALATIFGDLPGGRGRPALLDLLNDGDMRVQGPAITALARIGAPDRASGSSTCSTRPTRRCGRRPRR